MSERLAYPLFPLIWGWGIRFWGQKGPQTNNFWPSGALNEHFLTFLCFWPFFIKKMQYPVVLFQLIAQYMLSTDEYFSLSVPYVNFPIIGGPGSSIKSKKLKFPPCLTLLSSGKGFYTLSLTNWRLLWLYWAARLQSRPNISTFWPRIEHIKELIIHGATVFVLKLASSRHSWIWYC